MARGDRLNEALARRIRDSVYEITVRYPPPRPADTDVAPADAPVSPLTGPAPVQTVFPAAPVTTADPVTVRCLWLDSYVNAGSPTKISVNRVGWLASAQALARVLVSDTAVDPENPWGDTIFTGAEAVDFMTMRYRVLAIEPIGSSFAKPLTYHVWLTGAQKQT